jgi:chorismate synthase
VAAGAICQQFLNKLGVRLLGHVIAVGPVVSNLDSESMSMDELTSRVENSEMFCADESLLVAMKDYITQTRQDGDSVGGVVEVLAEGLPVGIGSYTQWDEKLDGQLAQALMSIQAIKAVEIGDGVRSAGLPGTQVHDALYPAGDSPDVSGSGGHHLPFIRKTNHAGGIEGGMTNGARLRVRAYMKPLPTLRKGLPSLSFPEYEAKTAHYERSDVCAVAATSVIAKAVVSLSLTRALLQKFGSDNFMEICQGVARHRQWCKQQGVSREQANAGDLAAPEMEME